MEDAKSAAEMASLIPTRLSPSLNDFDPRGDEGIRANADESTDQDNAVDRIFLQNQSSDGDPPSTKFDGDRDKKDGGNGVVGKASVADDATFSFYVAPKCVISSEGELVAPLNGFLTPAQIQIDEPVRVIPAGPSSCEDGAAEEKEIPFTFHPLMADSSSDDRYVEVNQHRADSLHINTDKKCPTEAVEPLWNHVKPADERGLIDTAAPIESVKEAVSKFGGILDWKAHKIQAMERCKFVEEELEKALEEIPEYKKRSEMAEEEKLLVLKDLDSTKRLIEDLKLNVERAQKEEYQARQDSDLAKLRMEEIEQGIEDEASYATRAQLEVTKARYSAAVSELSTVKEELEALNEEYVSLVEDKISALEKAEEAIAASREAERMVEELSIELIGAKEALESAQAAHLEAEEQRIGAAMAKEQQCLNCGKELRQVEEELSELNEQIKPVKDLKSKLETASTLLGELKAKLAKYMESAKREQEEGNEMEGNAQALKSELEMVKLNLEKLTAEVNCLKVAVASLEAELQTERMAIMAIKENEELALLTVESLKAELDRIKSEISLLQEKEYENQEKMVAHPKQLMQGAQDTDRATSFAERARRELNQAKEEAEQAKEGATIMQSQLEAVLKEIEVAKASEMLALEAIKALEDSESTKISSDADSTNRIKVSLEEYYELSRKARMAEEQANLRVAEAVSQIDVAKESERECLEKLEQVNLEKAKRKEELRYAMEKAEKSQASKLEIEQELRKWRAEHEQKRRDGGSIYGAETPIGNMQSYEETKEPNNFIRIPEHLNGYPMMPSSSETEPYTDTKPSKKKKKSFFPRILLFLARRKAHRHS